MKLFHQKIGSGKPIIILHGLYGFSDNWLTIARKLSDRFTVYLPDQRNHGRSPHDPEQSYEAMAADLYELMNDENLKEASIVGHSMGGKTAMLFSARHPEMVNRLVVVDIGPGGYATLDNPSPQSVIHLNIVNTLLSIDLRNFSSRTDIERELSITISDAAVRQFMMKNVHRNHDHTFSWKLNVEAIAKGLPEIMGPVDLGKYTGATGITGFPVLFIKGERSGYISPEQEELIRKYYPQAQVEVIPGAGHWVHADQPERFLAVLEKFLSITNKLRIKNYELRITNF